MEFFKSRKFPSRLRTSLFSKEDLHWKNACTFFEKSTQPSIRCVLRALVPWVKQAGRESDLYIVSMLSMVQIYLHSPYVFMVWYLIKHTENYTVYLLLTIPNFTEIVLSKY